MEPDLTGILIVALLGGGVTTFIGAIIKFFNAGDELNFYDDKKHNKEKVSKVVGGDIFFSGLGVIFIALFSIFISDKYHYSMMLLQIAVLLTGLLISTYHFFFTCKK